LSRDGFNVLDNCNVSSIKTANFIIVVFAVFIVSVVVVSVVVFIIVVVIIVVVIIIITITIVAICSRSTSYPGLFHREFGSRSLSLDFFAKMDLYTILKPLRRQAGHISKVNHMISSSIARWFFRIVPGEFSPLLMVEIHVKETTGLDLGVRTARMDWPIRKCSASVLPN